LEALRSPMFRRYYAASAASVQALWAQRVALGWLAWEVSASPAYVGAVAALSMAPTLISGPVFGVLVDRADILRAARWTTLTMAVVLFVAVLWQALWGFGLISLAVVALLIGVISSAHHPVRMSLAPRLVPYDLVASVVALSSVNFNTARLIAPVWAGVLLAMADPGWTLLAAAVLYLPMIVVLPSLTARPLPARSEQPSILRALGDGVAYVWRAPLVLQAIMLTAAFATVLRGFLEILPVLAEGVHGRGPTGLGVLTAAAGAGALLAAAAKTAGWGVVSDRITPGLKVGLVAGVGALSAIGLVPRWDVAVGVVMILGFASTYCGVTLQSVVQSNVPDDFRGRVMSLWVVVGFGAVALGALGLGVISDMIGLSATLIWAGLVGALLMAVLSLRSG